MSYYSIFGARHPDRYIDPATRAKASQQMLETSLEIAKGGMLVKHAGHPRRYIEGIAVSGPEVYNGTSLIAAGLKWDKEVPLVAGHGEYDVLGIVRSASARAGSAVVRFVAELLNKPGPKRMNVDEFWAELKCGAANPGVSVGFTILDRSPDNRSVITRWSLRELSLCNSEGADPYARITSVYEQPAPLYLDPRKNAPRVFWAET